MMQIVINISEEIYKRALPYKDLPIVSNLANDYPNLTYAVANGIPLPKGHGRLKDVDWIYNHTPTHWDDEDGSTCVTWEEIYDAPTIIEADKEMQ